MKRIDFYFFISLAVVLVALFGIPHFDTKQIRQHAAHPTAQQKASHMLNLLNERGRSEGVCTGTAIGPHAILTAEHCLEEEDRPDSINLDLATEKHHITHVAYDNRDHVIVLLDGTAFSNVEVFNQASSSTLGETVTLYGNGGKNYPSVPKYGKVMDCEDPSDVDETSGEFCTSLDVIPGDSGSAVYNTKGEIVGVVTYETTDEKYTNINFATNFAPEIIATALTYDGKPAPAVPSVKKKTPPHDDLENLLHSFFGE